MSQDREPTRTIRAVLWQTMPGSFPDEDDRREVLGLKPDLVVLPEYFAVGPAHRSPLRSFVDFDRNLDRLRSLAVELNCVVVGGTVVEKEGSHYYNTCFTFDRRITAGFYRKTHLMEGERAAGIAPGTGYQVLEAAGMRVGILICADALQSESFDAMREMGAEIIVVPTSSPFRPDDTPEAKETRDREIFVEGARRSGCWVLKTCSAGTLMGRPLQGRSLVASPDGIVARVPFDKEDRPHRLVLEVPLRSDGTT